MGVIALVIDKEVVEHKDDPSRPPWTANITGQIGPYPNITENGTNYTYPSSHDLSTYSKHDDWSIRSIILYSGESIEAIQLRFDYDVFTPSYITTEPFFNDYIPHQTTVIAVNNMKTIKYIDVLGVCGLKLYDSDMKILNVPTDWNVLNGPKPCDGSYDESVEWSGPQEIPDGQSIIGLTLQVDPQGDDFQMSTIAY